MSNLEEPEYIDELELSSHEFLSKDFLSWLKDRYESESTREKLDRYLSLAKRLDQEREPEKRSPLVRELFAFRSGTH